MRSVSGVGGEDGELGGEAAVVHFEDGFDHVGDVLEPFLRQGEAEPGGIFLLLEAGDGAEIREDFAEIDEEDADVVLAELVAPAYNPKTCRKRISAKEGATRRLLMSWLKPRPTTRPPSRRDASGPRKRGHVRPRRWRSLSAGRRPLRNPRDVKNPTLRN